MGNIMETIKEVLMRRDNMTGVEADELIQLAVEELYDRLSVGEDAEDICNEYFGLEPDYITELL